MKYTDEPKDPKDPKGPKDSTPTPLDDPTQPPPDTNPGDVPSPGRTEDEDDDS